ncbi:MAG: dihydrolipoyl dehydrogenase [Candidatus Krumholzibacteria bacterium]|nr:dihydrolipoyl dehydrogenase [Candidatus Krumholzibacteria bacterium]
MARECDVIVLGGGPAGYPAAIRAAQLGARVCLVERESLGGTCLNWGCIPTKALQGAAHLVERVREGKGRGIAGGPVEIDPEGLFANKSRVVKELVAGVEKLLKARRVEVLRGTGRLTNPTEVEVDGVGSISARKIVIATGSSEVSLPFMAFDSAHFLSSKDILDLARVPKSLLIVGGGVIGCEFASIFNAFGAKVTIVEMLPQLVATEDAQISRMLQLLFRKKGIELHLGSRVTAARVDGGVVVASLEGGAEVSAEAVLVSVGRRPYFALAGIEAIGAEADGTGIKVNAKMETSVPGVYAAGDVVGGALLAHVATREGIVAAENALGGSREMRYDVIPSTIYTLPEISRVGLTEDEARSKGIAVATGRFPFAANGKAKGLGEEDGFVKWVARESDKRLLGIHIIGPHATELLAPAIIALDRGMTGEEFASSIFPHPTLSEAVHGAAEAIYGRAIDLVK